MAGVITASVPSWIEPFTGLSLRCFGKLVASVRREPASDQWRGGTWSLPLEDRVLLVPAYWRTSVTMRQIAPSFGVSKSAADRIIDHLVPLLAIRQWKQFRKDTVLVVDGTLVPTRNHTVAEQSKNYRFFQRPIRWSSTLTPAWLSWSVVPCRASVTTPGAGRNPARRPPSAPP
ncbi:transposase family protein [Streptomyces sp. NPDC046716]|uniref:transposase family protein n=1 Tax=Streptomyces sp. NPDC046716 TaxID=3157093 RepID=UPI0033CDE8B2